MADYYSSFVHLLFIGLLALFPVVNPIGSALMVNHYFANLTKPEWQDRVADAFSVLLRYAPYLLSLRTRRRRFHCDGQLPLDYSM